MKRKRVNVERLLSLLFLAITLGVVLFFGLNGNDLADLAAALRRLAPIYLLLCLLSWMLYILFDALSIHYFLYSQGHRIKLRQSLRATIFGVYYCNITPGSSGGQPMEMYQLRKCGVPIGISGSGMAVKFVVFQVVLLLTGAALWIGNADFVAAYTDGSLWIVLLGYVANFFTVGAVLLMGINQKAMRWVIERCICIGVKLHICKCPQASRQKWENHCQSFLVSVQHIFRKPKDLLVQCLIAFAQLMSLMLTVLAVYHALGLHGVSNIQLVTMGVLLYISASYVPSPGASGAQEGGFAVLFRQIFPDATLFVALLIWRFATYYLTILVGVALTIVESIQNLRHSRSAAPSVGEAEK